MDPLSPAEVRFILSVLGIGGVLILIILYRKIRNARSLPTASLDPEAQKVLTSLVLPKKNGKTEKRNKRMWVGWVRVTKTHKRHILYKERINHISLEQYVSTALFLYINVELEKENGAYRQGYPGRLAKEWLTE